MKNIFQAMKGGRPSTPYIQYADIFKKLDVERVSREFNLDRNGRVAGQAEKPPTESDSNDAVENKIISLIEDEKNKSYEDAVKEFSAYRSRLKDLGIDTLVQQLEEGKRKITTDIRAKLATLKDSTLYRQSRDVVRANKDLKHFREVNMLTREPQYSESKLLGWLLIIFIFFIESVLNGYFFAKGHQFGYIGGISIAIIISFVNIIFNSYLLGWCFLHQITHKNWGRKIFGFFSLLLFVSTTLVFNVAVAHFRQAYVLQSENPGYETLRTLVSTPLQLHDFESYMLILMGLAVCIISCIKIWSMYDHYPGYEKLHKKLDELLEDYAHNKTELVEDLQTVRDDGFNEINNALRQLEISQVTYRELIDKMAHLKSLIEPHFVQLEQNGRELLAIYRGANASTRSIPIPDRWRTEYKLSRPDLLSFQVPSAIDVSSILNNARQELPKITKNINDECRNAIEGLVSLSELEKNKV